MIKPLDRPDSFHLEAAQGWLELGDHLEANEELDEITPQFRAHPDVLAVRYNIYAKANSWEMAAEIAQALCTMVPDNPFGFIHLAFALHGMKQTKEAWNLLLPVVDKFSDYIIRYNLACYAAQLGNLKEAWQWLEKAIDLVGKKEVKLMALNDPDLEPLWMEIGEI